MRVGVPKEIKVQEYRVGLTPGAVREYVAAGHRVTVETGAGSGIGASDDVYRRAGATIAESARDVFAKSDMIVKVKEPQKSSSAKARSCLPISILHPTRSRPRACLPRAAPRSPMRPSRTRAVTSRCSRR